MRPILVLAAAATVFGAALPAGAAESLLVGRVERIVLLPSGVQECPPVCPPAVADADGSTRVCISNAGGCQRTAFRVERVLLGEGQPGPREFAGRIGEWGSHDFPVEHEAILVHVDGERVRWSRLAERDGALYFDARPFGQELIQGVAVSTLAPDAGGQVALRRLLERVKAGP